MENTQKRPRKPSQDEKTQKLLKTTEEHKEPKEPKEPKGPKGHKGHKGPAGDFWTYGDWESQLDASWHSALQPFLDRDQLRGLHNWVSQEYAASPCRPPAAEIFTAFKMTPFDQVKVVVVGQDPYPGPTEAMGLSFSVHRGVKVPGSLRNIYKCLQTDPLVDFTIPKHGDLSNWATQGVFMLNAVLTVRQGAPNSHAKRGWETFTDEVIKLLNTQRNGLVFMLWGAFAQAKAKSVNRSKHLVLEACHPSPLSAAKGGFYTCGHFSRANAWLKDHGTSEIDWNLTN